MTKLLLIAVPHILLDGAAETQVGETRALPARSCTLSWQTIFDDDPDAVNITLEVSIDGVVWDVIDTTTEVSGELKSVNATAAPFVRGQVNSITAGSATTIQIKIIAKVAVP